MSLAIEGGAGGAGGAGGGEEHEQPLTQSE